MKFSAEEKATLLADLLFSGGADAELENKLRAWLLGPEDQDAKERAVEKAFYHYVTEDSAPDEEVHRLLRQLNHRYETAEELLLREAQRHKAELKQKVGLRRRNARRRWTVIAAGSAAAVLLVFAGVRYALQPGNNGSAPQAPAELAVFSASAHEHHKHVLPDNSSVTLHAGSVLSYEARDKVTLHGGRAFFDVRSTETDEAAFRVESPNLGVTVLGTSFVLADHPDAELATLVLYHGEVRLETRRSQVRHITAGNLVVLDVATGEIYVRPLADDELTPPQWTLAMGALSFDDAPLSLILDEIAARYGITLNNTRKELGDERYMFSLSGDETLSETMDILSATSCLFSYRIEGDTLYIE
ncbi:MAG: DUF4974 domain-containing protein [Rikenellaceae bacterium]|nr:DUF4974 domain-containing protein [Rikenellaceae bacterium]MCL2691926.1 DUF4974 domain-containing protein [Rikenellaceae bacterium]